jgi:hypothetical protein
MSSQERILNSKLEIANSVIKTIYSTVHNLHLDLDSHDASDFKAAIEFISTLIETQANPNSDTDSETSGACITPTRASTSRSVSQIFETGKVEGRLSSATEKEREIFEHERDLLQLKLKHMEQKYARLQCKYDDTESKLSFLEFENATLQDQVSPTMSSFEDAFSDKDSMGHGANSAPAVMGKKSDRSLESKELNEKRSTLESEYSYGKDSAISMGEHEDIESNVHFHQLMAFLNSEEGQSNPLNSTFVKSCLEQEISTCLPLDQLGWYEARCLKQGLLDDTLELEVSELSPPSDTPHTCQLCKLTIRIPSQAGHYRTNPSEEWTNVCYQCRERISASKSLLDFLRQLPKDKQGYQEKKAYLRLVSLKKEMLYAKHGVYYGINESNIDKLT